MVRAPAHIPKGFGLVLSTHLQACGRERSELCGRVCSPTFASCLCQRIITAMATRSPTAGRSTTRPRTSGLSAWPRRRRRSRSGWMPSSESGSNVRVSSLGRGGSGGFPEASHFCRVRAVPGGGAWRSELLEAGLGRAGSSGTVLHLGGISDHAGSSGLAH